MRKPSDTTLILSLAWLNLIRGESFVRGDALDLRKHEAKLPEDGPSKDLEKNRKHPIVCFLGGEYPLT